MQNNIIWQEVWAAKIRGKVGGFGHGHWAWLGLIELNGSSTRPLCALDLWVYVDLFIYF